MATAPLLLRAVRKAAASAPLTLLAMQDVTFVDGAGARALLDAASEVRQAGGKLVIAPLHRDVQRLLDMADVVDAFDVLARPAVDPLDAAALVSAAAERPPRNPVNAAIVPARTMAVADRHLWMQTETASILRAWAPAPLAELAQAGRPIELYLDHEGAVNGWRDTISNLAVNQRRLDAYPGPLVGTPMWCQGPCGLTWQAPAPALMIEHGEHCLTCAGPLVPG